MNNITQLWLTSQIKNSENKPYSIGFFRESLNESDQIVTKLFVTNFKNHHIFRYSHAYIAQVTGLSISTVKRSLVRLQKHGIIQSIWRPYDTCIYVLHEFFTRESFLKQLRMFFIGFFSISALSSIEGGERLLMLNESILLKREGSAPNGTAGLSCWQVMQMNIRYGGSAFRASGSWTYQENEANTQKGEGSMFNFTMEQQKQVLAYGPQAVERAKSRLKEVISKGNPPQDMFGWFVAVCKNYRAGEETQPKAPRAAPVKQDDREMLRMRRDRILLKAQSMGIDTQGHTLGEVEILMRGFQVIPLGVGIPKPVAQQKEVVAPRDWNSLLPVSDNAGDIMPNELLQPVFYDDSDDFQEILD